MLIDELPFVLRHVLRLIAGRKIAGNQMLRREIDTASNLNHALESLKRRGFIEPVQRSWRITQAGLECAGMDSSANQTPQDKPTTKPRPAAGKPINTRTEANTIASLGSRSLPFINTAGSWSKTNVPICNASTKGPYLGAELRPFTGRAGAYDFLRAPSLHTTQKASHE